MSQQYLQKGTNIQLLVCIIIKSRLSYTCGCDLKLSNRSGISSIGSNGEEDTVDAGAAAGVALDALNNTVTK